MVRGKVRLRGQLASRFWLWSVVILSAGAVIYWKIWAGKLASQKSAVMAKQRAVALTLTPKVVPFRDRIEQWVQELAQAPKPDHVQKGMTLVRLNSQPGVYLRLRIANARDVESIRASAANSLLDGFTSCLFVRKGEPNPAEGPACRSSADCAPGLLCNEYSVCVPPPKPYNMRLAYRALRVLTASWTDELHEAVSELEVKAYERDLERVAQDDVPIAVQLLKRASFFTLVLDEDPEAGLPEPLDSEEIEEERVQRAGHAARVAVWSLKTNDQLLRIRAQAAGRFVPVGEKVARDPKIVAAQQRQANSCALALAVKRALANSAQPEGAGPAVQAQVEGGGADAGAASGAGARPQPAVSSAPSTEPQ